MNGKRSNEVYPVWLGVGLVLCGLLMPFSLIYSRAMISIVTGLLLMLGLGYTFYKKKYKVHAIVDEGTLPNPWHLLLLSAPFWPTLISGLWSQNQADWLNLVRVQLPLIFLPLAFILLPPLSARTWRVLLTWMVGCIVVSSLHVLIVVIPDWDYYMEILGHGKPVYTPANHIRYSMMVSFAVVVSLYFGLFHQTKASTKWKLVLLWLFIFQHFLSVRSGLVLAYGGCGLLLVYFFWYKNISWKTAIWWTSGTAFLIAFLIALTPSLRNKIAYMRHDWQQYEQGAGKFYSDSERLTSLQLGIDIWKTSPWYGIGAGDLFDAMKTRYDKRPDVSSKKMYPHNQWISIGAGIGWVGLFLISMMLGMAYWRIGTRVGVLFWVFQVMIFLSCWVENTFYTSVGVIYSVFWSCVLVRASAAYDFAKAA